MCAAHASSPSNDGWPACSYSNGLASTFYANLYPAGSTAKDNFPLVFPSSPTIERCGHHLDMRAHNRCPIIHSS